MLLLPNTQNTMNIFSRFLEKRVLKTFFAVELNTAEQHIAQDAVKEKYARALQKGVIYSLLSIIPIQFLDTGVIISVLIPITMVAGTAWFAISLANIKQKFDRFGLELTTDLFEAFTVSLGLLLMLSIFSLLAPFLQETIEAVENPEIWQALGAVIGIFIIANIVYKIFIGSMKYDINDSMLAGQNEAAERFFRKSLSLLHTLSSTLQRKKSLHVANYYFGVAFFEIFSHMQKFGVDTQKHIEQANTLIQNPSIDQKEADDIAKQLINVFLELCINPQGSDAHKSLQAIQDEMDCLKKNTQEDQEMVDTRMSVILAEIADLLEDQGETLFVKPE